MKEDNAKDNIRISQNKAQEIIQKQFLIKRKLVFLGKGSEGYVFTDNISVYKLIDNSVQPLELYWTLLSLSERINKDNIITVIPNFEVLKFQNYVLIKYKFERTLEFTENTQIHVNKYLNLLKQLWKIGWTLSDFQPQNIRLTENEDLVIVDIGKSFIPTSNYLFQSMCRRAFVTYKLQGRLLDSNEFKKYLSRVNEFADFSLMRSIDFCEETLIEEYNSFYKNIIN
jgi:hypothetical protein